MAKKIVLNEETLRQYIDEAVRYELYEMLDEDTWWKPWTWGRDAKNRKWNYTWDDNLSDEENRRRRDLNKAQIKAKGYNNAEEYEAGEGHRFGEEAPSAGNGAVSTNPAADNSQATAQPPEEYPYKQDSHKTAQFQTWYNQNMGGNLVVDGIWGPRTEEAYKHWLMQATGTRPISEGYIRLRNILFND